MEKILTKNKDDINQVKNKLEDDDDNFNGEYSDSGESSESQN